MDRFGTRPSGIGNTCRDWHVPRAAVGGSREARVSGQLESRHFFRTGDTVRDLGGTEGTVIQAGALFALIEWAGDTTTEVEQFDPSVTVLERAEPA